MNDFIKYFILVAGACLLTGCNLVVMSPSGDIATQQRDLIIVSVVLMLIIIVPVIFLTLFFAWKYRHTNETATYRPDWHHSTRLEVLIWSAPLAIIIALGAVTWASTHQLDPYRPISRLDSTRSLPENQQTLTIEVVALDWKWLFFYPELGIATINELAAPVDVPISFKLTASSVMNTFYVPALAGMIYTMPGMQTRLHAVINREGTYDGFSGNYSGDGFSRMRFQFLGMQQAAFNQWVEKAKREGTPLTRDAYMALEKPSVREPVRYYQSFDTGLYNAILNLCVAPGKVCMNEVMHRDMHGNEGAPIERSRLEYDNRHNSTGRPGATFPETGNPAKSPQEIEPTDHPEPMPQSDQPADSHQTH